VRLDEGVGKEIEEDKEGRRKGEGDVGDINKETRLLYLPLHQATPQY
jgi:hypothetical protein